MANEPTDGDEELESSDANSEDNSGEEEEASSAPEEAKPETASADESMGPVVEAQVVSPNVRKPFPRALVAGAVGVLVIGGAIFAFDSSVREGEASAFGEANERDTVESWEGYLAWAEDEGFWTRSRTPLERHIQYAEERRDVQRAYAATAASEWDALCTMLEEFGGETPAFAATRRALQGRSAAVAERTLALLSSSNVPVSLRDPVEAAFMEITQNSPCSGEARLRFHVTTDSNLLHGDALISAASASIDVGLQPVVQELSGQFEPFVFALVNAESAEPVTMEYAVVAKFVPGDTVRLGDGSTFTIPSLQVNVRVNGPSGHASSQVVTYPLPPAFGVELYAQSQSGKSPEELSVLAVERLVAHVPGRLRQVAGLAGYLRDGGVAAYSRCRGMEVIDRSMRVSSNTRDDGTDRIHFSCEEPEEPYDYNEACCDGEDYTVGRPEVGYRLTVNEPSVVALTAVAEEHGALVSIFSECGPSSRELSCSELGVTQMLLTPGVYTAYVGGTMDEEAGPYELLTSITPVTQAESACAAVTRELQPGVATNGDTSRSTDNFAGACGGAGVGDDTYRLTIAERSRVRCTVDGFSEAIVHIRTDCGDFETETACGMGSARMLADAGTLFVNVDGFTRESKGDYDITCEVVPVPPPSSASMCASAESIELTMGEDTPVLVDLLNAPRSNESMCAGSGGPERMYRFEVTEDVYLRTGRASPTTRIALLDECEQGRCSSSISRRLSAGTHYFVARGRERLDFGRETINLRATPIASICEEAVLLREGVTGGVIGDTGDPAIFGAECSSSTSLREAIFRVRALHPMHIQVSAEGVGLSIHEGCGGRSLTCSPVGVGNAEARLAPGEYTVLVRGNARRTFQLTTEIERL